MMKTIAALAVSLTLAGLASAEPTTKPARYGFLHADGMTGHLARELNRPGSGPHEKHRVVRAQAFGSANDAQRPFVAYTEGPAAATSTNAVATRYQFITGHVDTTSGKVVVKAVEAGLKK